MATSGSEAPPFLFDGPPGGPTLVLTHGAGAPVDSPPLQAIAAGLGAAGVRVARFELPYMRLRRDTGARRPPDREPVLRRAWLQALQALQTLQALPELHATQAPHAIDAIHGAPAAQAGGVQGGAQKGAGALFIGGKSLGGRIASLIADEAGVAGLVCLGYPFLPPGSAGPPRTAHLRELRTSTLIVQGTRDPFGGPEAVAGYVLSPAIEVQWIEDGDHSFAPRRASGRTTAQNLAEAAAVAAAWIKARAAAPSGGR